MVRGIERRVIFADDADRMDLLDHLCQIVPECGAAFLVWVFMSNHLHYVVRTGTTPLSQIMRRLNTGFAVRFNLRHERVGYLFQNRFRSRLVTSDDDLRNLVRYVCLNPLEAGMVPGVAELEHFRWSAYGALQGRRTAYPFEDVSGALSVFADSTLLARSRLSSWMQSGVDSEETPADDFELLASLGPSPRVDRLLPDGQDLAGIMACACELLGVRLEELRTGKRSEQVSRARALICHVAVTRWRFPSSDVAEAVGVSRSAVSHALARGARIEEEVGF